MSEKERLVYPTCEEHLSFPAVFCTREEEEIYLQRVREAILEYENACSLSRQDLRKTNLENVFVAYTHSVSDWGKATGKLTIWTGAWQDRNAN